MAKHESNIRTWKLISVLGNLDQIYWSNYEADVIILTGSVCFFNFKDEIEFQEVNNEIV